MRLADPKEMKTPAVPVLAAKLTETELSKWVPVEFKEITNPEETPEPAKAALIKLSSGAYAVLFYGRDSNQLVVQFAQNGNLSRNATAFLNEVPLPHARIVWHRSDVELPKGSVAKSSTPASVKLRTSVTPSRKTASLATTAPHSKSGRARASSRSAKKR